MKTTLFAIPILAICLNTSCASSPDIIGHDELLQSVGDRFVGRPVQDIAMRYGMPNTQQNLQGEKVYSWFSETTIGYTNQVQSTTKGSIGNTSQYPWSSIPYQQTTVTNQRENVNYQCRLDVFVKPDGNVRTLGFYGKMGACNQFRLDR